VLPSLPSQALAFPASVRTEGRERSLDSSLRQLSSALPLHAGSLDTPSGVGHSRAPTTRPFPTGPHFQFCPANVRVVLFLVPCPAFGDELRSDRFSSEWDARGLSWPGFVYRMTIGQRRLSRNRASATGSAIDRNCETAFFCHADIPRVFLGELPLTVAVR